MEALGDIIGGAVTVAQAVIQAPLGICANSYLAAVNLAVQAYADLEIDGRVQPVSEYFFSIAHSGERKTATDRFATYELKQHEALQERKYATELADYQASKEFYERKKRADKSESLEGYRDAVGAIPEEPLRRTIIVTQPTIEAAQKLLITGQPSLGLFTNEGGQLIGGHSMKDENKIKTAAALNSL